MVNKIEKTIVRVIIIMVVLAVAGTIFYNNFVKEQKQPVDTEIIAPDLVVDKENDFEEAIKVFEKEAFKSLIKFGDWPLRVIDKGRPNPFLKI